MHSQLTALLKEVTEQYMKWSPHELSCETVNKFINGVQFTKPDRNKVDSTGICYLVATFVKDYMEQHYAADVEFFFIWREFDPEYGEDEDDTLHAGIYSEGKYYDTYNPEGVDDIKELTFYQNQLVHGVKLFTRHEPDWIQFGKDAFVFSVKKEDKFINYLKEVLP
jgi:hypothetical protein